jgi:hypothetical protein
MINAKFEREVVALQEVIYWLNRFCDTLKKQKVVIVIRKSLMGTQKAARNPREGSNVSSLNTCYSAR